jgi:hypothetical protein
MAQMARSLAHSGTPRTQLLSIQYLRGLAALSVLVTHALQWPLAEMNIVLLKTGRLGVDVFFVISGFIITTIAGDGRFNPKEFLVRRGFRILPAYWGSRPRAPLWMQKVGLEWAWRIWLEPRRLFWRYLTTNPRALYLLFQQEPVLQDRTDAARLIAPALSSCAGENPLRLGARIVGAISAGATFPDVKSRLPRMRVRPLHRRSRTG